MKAIRSRLYLFKNNRLCACVCGVWIRTLHGRRAKNKILNFEIESFTIMHNAQSCAQKTFYGCLVVEHLGIVSIKRNQGEKREQRTTNTKRNLWLSPKEVSALKSTFYNPCIKVVIRQRNNSHTRLEASNSEIKPFELIDDVVANEHESIDTFSEWRERWSRAWWFIWMCAENKGNQSNWRLKVVS